MILRSFFLLTASLWSLACGSTRAPLVPPEAASINQAHAIHVDVGSVRSLATLHDILPRALAQHGYFITHTQQRTMNGLEFVTDWRASGTQARTRLIVDARPRGDRVAITLYALSYAEADDGSWRAVSASGGLRQQLHDISTQITLAARAAVRP